VTTSPTPDRVTAIYDAIDAFQRQHRTVGGLQHAQIRALLAEHLDQALPTEPDVPQPSSDRAVVDLPARLEAVLTERYTELGNPFSEMRRHEQGPDGWPASHPIGPRVVADVLRELLADEAQP
jgi:hypothetical protein